MRLPIACMTNVLATTGRAAMARVRFRLHMGVLAVCVGQRLVSAWPVLGQCFAALFTRRVFAASQTSVGWVPPVRRQFLDSAV